MVLPPRPGICVPCVEDLVFSNVGGFRVTYVRCVYPSYMRFHVSSVTSTVMDLERGACTM